MHLYTCVSLRTSRAIVIVLLNGEARTSLGFASHLLPAISTDLWPFIPTKIGFHIHPYPQLLSKYSKILHIQSISNFSLQSISNFSPCLPSSKHGPTVSLARSWKISRRSSRRAPSRRPCMASRLELFLFGCFGG